MNCAQAFRRLRHLAEADAGQDLIEYGLLMSLIAIVAMVGVTSVGEAIKSIFWDYIAASL